MAVVTFPFIPISKGRRKVTQQRNRTLIVGKRKKFATDKLSVKNTSS